MKPTCRILDGVAGKTSRVGDGEGRFTILVPSSNGTVGAAAKDNVARA